MDESVKKKFLAEFLDIDIKTLVNIDENQYKYLDKETGELSYWEVIYTGLSCRAVCKKVSKGGMPKKDVKISIDVPANIFCQLIMTKKRTNGSLRSIILRLLQYAMSFKAEKDE